MSPQCMAIVSYCKTVGPVSQASANSDLGIQRLANRISELEKVGYLFSRKRYGSISRYGNPCRYMEYTLESEPDESTGDT